MIIGIIALLFGILNIQSVQEYIKEKVVSELKAKLNTELSIDKLHFQPFDVVELNGVNIYDQQNEQVLRAEKLYADISLYPLLRKKVIITDIRLDNFDVNLSKETSGSPLNIQFIIDAFKPKEENKDQTQYEIKINSVNITGGNFNFDIKDKPYKQDVFDANHIQVSNLNARLTLKSLKGDSLNIEVKKLNLEEKSGFEIKNLLVRLITSNQFVYVKGFELETPKSLLRFEKCEIDISKPNTSTSGNLLENARFDVVIAPSYITPKDISPFTPILKNFNDRIYLKAGISGKIDDISLLNLAVDYGEKMHLIANASVKDIQKSDSLYLTGNVSELQITSDGVEGLINNFSSDKKDIPAQLVNLGNVSFRGNVSGYLDKLKAYGLLNTDLGAIKTDLLFGFAPHKGIDSYFSGKISTNEFKLGTLLANQDLNTLSFDLSIDLHKRTRQKMNGEIKGNIGQFDYKNYTYSNITLDGGYDGQKIRGGMSIDDENVILSLNGLFDLSKDQPVLDFTARLKNLRLDRLHLSNKYPGAYLSLNVDANFTGKDIDDATGYLSVDSIRFQREGRSFFMNKFMAEASGVSTDRKLKITSDILNGEVLGAYSFTTMVNSIKQSLNPYLPALITARKEDKSKIEENALSLNFTIGNTENISDIFSLPFTVFSEAKIIGSYNNRFEKFQLDVYYPSGKVAGMVMKSGELHLENDNNRIKTDFSGIIMGKNNVSNNITLDLEVHNNTIDTKLSFTNDSKQKFRGSFIASATFTKEDKNSPLLTDIQVSPSELIVNDTLWQLDPSYIKITPDFISVKDFSIHNSLRNQSIKINGQYAKANPDDILKVDLERIDLEYVFNTLAIDALNFGGLATGSLYASSVEQKPYMNVKLDVGGFKFNNTLLGDLNLYSELDEETKKVVLKGLILDSEKRKTNIDGFINPINQELSINFEADKIDVGFLNKYVSTLFNNIKGQGSGNVHLYGNFSRVTVEGKAFIENGSLGINFLNTSYSFTDTVYMKNDLIYFNDIKFSDQYNNKANISGKVVHDYFSNFMYHVELTGENFMLYNATPRLNPTFYGKVFGTGSGSIGGDEQVVNINARIKSDNNTSVGMNFMEETIDNYSFITYKSKDSTRIANEEPVSQLLSTIVPSKAISTESGIDINISLYVEATPEATVEIIMDPVGGDILRGSGSGIMQFEWGTKTAPKLYGTYTINKGSYNFTFQKIVERKFSIRQGSTVMFRGDPFQANLNVDAIYKVNANLNDLDESLAENTGHSTVPVECILNITGELRHPNIGFAVDLPSVDSEIQRQVKSMMNTEDMVNKQMVYLLLLSKFYTPDPSRAEHRSSDWASLASATLSTQLSKILSSIDDRWQIGTNIRTSDSEMTSTEVELILSSQLLNDRVLINGNFGYKDNPQTQATFVGDVDIEVLLNTIGTWRLKAYNHYNDKYYIINGSGDGSTPLQTQGVGIMYKKDFDHLKEFFGIKPRLTPVKKDTIVPIIPDSTIKGSSLGDFIRIKE